MLPCRGFRTEWLYSLQISLCPLKERIEGLEPECNIGIDIGYKLQGYDENEISSYRKKLQQQC